MRIVYVTPYPPARDGLATYTAALVGAICAEGHAVRIVSAREPDSGATEVIGALPRSRSHGAALLAHITEWDPDVVHVQFTVAAFTTRIPALLRLLEGLQPHRACVFVTLHEVTGDTALLRGVGRAIYRRVTKLADVAVVHTDTSLAELTDRVGAVPSTAAVIPHPRMDPPPATATPAELRDRHGLADARVLLFFGFIHVDKGLDDLVRALHLLDQWRSTGADDIRLVVAGAVPVRHGLAKPFEMRNRLYLERIRRSIARWGLTDRVVFAGYVPPGEVAAWFALAAAAVLPYRRNEQSGVASLAVGVGTPLLISDVGGLAETAGGTRWTFPPRAPHALAQTLAAFLQQGDRHGHDAPEGMGAPPIAEVASQTLSLYRNHLSTAVPATEREATRA